VDLSIFSLEGKVAIVTGATGGLGMGICEGLAGAGADIAGVDVSDDFSKTKKIVEDAGRKFLGVQADLGKMESINQIVDQVKSHFGCRYHSP